MSSGAPVSDDPGPVEPPAPFVEPPAPFEVTGAFAPAPPAASSALPPSAASFPGLWELVQPRTKYANSTASSSPTLFGFNDMLGDFSHSEKEV
jgi:hypothetical protein